MGFSSPGNIRYVPNRTGVKISLCLTFRLVFIVAYNHHPTNTHTHKTYKPCRCKSSPIIFAKKKLDKNIKHLKTLYLLIFSYVRGILVGFAFGGSWEWSIANTRAEFDSVIRDFPIDSNFIYNGVLLSSSLELYYGVQKLFIQGS